MKRILAEDTINFVGKDVQVAGWVDSIRDHGGLVFLDLRDWSGVVQLVVDPSLAEEAYTLSQELGNEFVISAIGSVVNRTDELINDKLATGKIEISVKSLELLNKSKPIPFPLNTDGREIDENLRYKYRYIDLRRKRVAQNIRRRHEVMLFIRNWMSEHDFTEIQTPLLTVSSPEGARDFLVPSRIHKGKFYALPQAPQQYKQLLMVGGIHRYFQIAPCLRDEDPRHDRFAGAFYQLDVECSFTTQDEFFALMEPLFKDLVENVTDKHLVDYPFKQIAYRESLEKYGTDKPDLRFGMEHAIVTDVLKESSMDIFKNVDLGKALLVHKQFSRKEIDELTQRAKDHGAGGLLWFKVTEDLDLDSSAAKFFSKDLKDRLKSSLEEFGDKVEAGDTIFVAAGESKLVNTVMSDLRSYFGDILELKDKNKLAFAWIVDFPMYEWDEEAQKYEFMHNPFSMPQGGMKALNEEKPENILAYQYDLVCNGYEFASGAIRNHEPETFIKAFEITGYTEEKVRDKFGHMINAFEYGAPPHGGFAPGIDRMMMVLFDEPNIREVYAFPKNSNAEEVMTNAPRKVDNKQLQELGLKLIDDEADVVYRRIIRMLDKSDVKYELLKHKSAKTSEEAAKIRGTLMSMAPKAMILKKSSGEFLMVAVPADMQVDIEKVSAVVGDKVTVADSSEVESEFGVKVGAVPPFGNLFGIDFYLDKEFWNKDDVVFNVGRRDRSVKMKATDLIKISQPMDISKNTDFKE